LTLFLVKELPRSSVPCLYGVGLSGFTTVQAFAPVTFTWGRNLEWAPDPATAFDWAVILNDRCELDGGDPNGYAGIGWVIVGKLDRPWFNRPVFGLARSMTSASYSRKFDGEAYIRQHGSGKGGAPQPT